MKIILEGADGAGKTTLAHILAEKYGLDVCHCTQHDAADYDFYKQTLRKDNVVWDRHTIGELIYPFVFNRAPQITPEDARLVMIYASKEHVKTFVLTADIDVLFTRLRAREKPEDDRIVNSLNFIDEKFRFYAEMFDIPVIDTSKMTLSEIFELVEKEEKPIKFVH
jgi:thymidylate kinase